MTRPRRRAAEPEPTLADRLAGLSIAEIDAMSDQEIADLMGATAEETATEPARTWRAAAKAATSEHVGKLIADVESGRRSSPTQLRSADASAGDPASAVRRAKALRRRSESG